MVRRFLNLIFAVALMTSLAACGSFDIPFDRSFDFEVDIEHDENELEFNEEEVDVTEEDALEPIRVSLVDFGDQEIFTEASDSIEKIDVKKATLQILSIDEENLATALSGTVEISGTEEGAERVLLAPFNEVAVEVGEPVELTIDEKGLEELQKLALEEPHAFQVHIDGQIDGRPAKFTGRLSLSLVITVKLEPDTINLAL